MCVCVCVCVCVTVCVRAPARMRVCVCARARMCVCVFEVHMCIYEIMRVCARGRVLCECGLCIILGVKKLTFSSLINFYYIQFMNDNQILVIHS